MNRMLKILSVSLIALGASFLQAANLDAESDKEELSSRKASLSDAHAVPEHLPVIAMLEGTDTKVLLECMAKGNTRPFFDFIKDQRIGKIEVFIDALLPTNGLILDASVNIGKDLDCGPADRTRDALKAALVNKVRSLDLASRDPVSANIESLSIYHANVVGEIAQALEEYIEILAPEGDVSNFLDPNIIKQSEHRSRGGFKQSICTALYG